MKYLVMLFMLMLPVLLLAQPGLPVKPVFDADIQTGDVVVWSADTVYVLQEFVFVDSLAELHIQPGTVIKAEDGQGANAAALIVARGGKIFAEGTAEKPIIFTTKYDDVTDPNDMLPQDRGLWGGVIILGRATNNVPGGVGQIEGIPETERRARYGGNDDDDNSGVFRYVSIRHGGTNIGSGNEINGLTMGSVGRGTTIEYVEVYNNDDDGFEWFGGTVNTRYLVSAFNQDDSFDYDQGFRGKHQFWFALQDSAAGVGNRGAEMDGGTSSAITAQPYSMPEIYNVTYIGSGANSNNTDNDRALYFRENAGGTYGNSIFYDFKGIALKLGDTETFNQLLNGNLSLKNCLFFNFGGGNNWTNLISVSGGDKNVVIDTLGYYGNQIADPQLGNIPANRRSAGALDPRPANGSAAASGFSVPNDPFFTQVDYAGAFEPDAPLWTNGWTWISQIGYTGISEEKMNTHTMPNKFELSQNYPNPFNPTTNIAYSLAKTARVEIAVYNVLGEKVATLVDGQRSAGHYQITFDATNLSSGIYFYRMKVANNVKIRRMILMK
ncbi:MAG: hypothetical protein Kow0037_14190 [Calditrichia bacterium]